MRTSNKASTRALAGVSFALAAAALVALGAKRSKDERLLGERVSMLAASVERLQVPPPERVVEYHTVREITQADRPASPAGAEPGGEASAPPTSEGAFDPKDEREFRAGRGPHPIVPQFERESAERSREVAARQTALDATLAAALDGLDADVHEAECRASTCRVDVTFDSGASSNTFAGRAFIRGAGELPPFDHGGVFAPVQEETGGRHHSVFYVTKRTPEG